MSNLSSDSAIDIDLPCTKCKYNLRTLLIVDRCPECGHPNLRTVILARMPRPESFRLPDPLAYRRCALAILAELLDVEPAALDHVFKAQSRAAWHRMGTPTADGKRDLGARDLCHMVVRLAELSAGNPSDGAALLRRFNLTTSEQIGRIVPGFVESGLLAATGRDSPDDFRGVWRLH